MSEKRTEKKSSSLWWLKPKSKSPAAPPESPFSGLSNSMAEFLEQEKLCQNEPTPSAADIKDSDITNLLEEINRLAAKSPGLKADLEGLSSAPERTIEDILREAEELSQASSKNLEELTSSRSTSSLRGVRSTPLTTPRSTKSTPKSPHNILTDQNQNSSIEYDDTFSKSVSDKSQIVLSASVAIENENNLIRDEIIIIETDNRINYKEESNDNICKVEIVKDKIENEYVNEKIKIEHLEAEVKEKDKLLNEYEKDNQRLRYEIKLTKDELEETKNKLMNEGTIKSNKITDKQLQHQLHTAQENLKDLQEHNTVLQLQLDTLNKSHQVLKTCNDELTLANKTLERKLIENEALITRLRNELKSLQDRYNILQNSECLLKKSVEQEKLQNKTLKVQNEKDAKSIQDLTRQVKEMERIITRKHPDSVSALILAANTTVDANSNNARQLLEDRIKQLEAEAKERDLHSTKIFTDVQEKFNTMKQKYENHIQDLEKHVNELKTQINSNFVQLIDQETQTYLDVNRNVNCTETAVQTITHKIPKLKRSTEKLAPPKEDTHLLATIRGLNQEITNKERTMAKLQKEMDELRKTNRRLQKERESALKSSTNNKMYNPNEFRLDYDTALVDNAGNLENMSIQYNVIRDEKDKLKIQLARLEDDYQMLKLKRLQDLNTLQEAHEQELTNYMGKMAPLREQLEVQQVTIKKLQQQLAAAREQIAVLNVERDHLEQRLKSLRHLERDFTSSGSGCGDIDNDGTILGGGQSFVDDVNNMGGGNGSTSASGGNTGEYAVLRRKISQLEHRYEEREQRLRAIVQGLAQKQSMSTVRDCEQCAIRQQQLIGYKAELDQVLSTLRNHTNL